MQAVPTEARKGRRALAGTLLLGMAVLLALWVLALGGHEAIDLANLIALIASVCALLGVALIIRVPPEAERWLQIAGGCLLLLAAPILLVFTAVMGVAAGYGAHDARALFPLTFLGALVSAAAGILLLVHARSARPKAAAPPDR